MCLYLYSSEADTEPSWSSKCSVISPHIFICICFICICFICICIFGSRLRSSCTQVVWSLLLFLFVFFSYLCLGFFVFICIFIFGLICICIFGSRLRSSCSQAVWSLLLFTADELPQLLLSVRPSSQSTLFSSQSTLFSS